MSLQLVAERLFCWPTNTSNRITYAKNSCVSRGRQMIMISAMSHFYPESSQKTPNSSPVRARYGMYYVRSNSDLYSASVFTVICAISCYIGSRYNGIRLAAKTWACITAQTNWLVLLLRDKATCIIMCWNVIICITERNNGNTRIFSSLLTN